jgi:hypothetical protein
MIIDDRAGSLELAMIPPLDEIAMVSRLESGDVSITGNGPDRRIMAIGVEVKSMSDLLQSLSTGRVQDQLGRMLEAYDVCWLLTYGHYISGPFNNLQVWRGGRWHNEKQGGRSLPFGYVESFLLSAGVSGVAHKHVQDENQAAAWLAVLERWWSKEWSEHRAFNKFNRSGELGLVPDIGAERLRGMRVAADLPSIGWAKAEAATGHFPSIRAMMNAGADEWAKVEGVGKVIAKAVVTAINAVWRDE